MNPKSFQFLIISGVHKSGTTSLFNYLARHHQIAASSVKETHFFTPIRYGQETKTIENYLNYFSHAKKDQICLEASPSYVYGGKPIASKIKKDLGENTKSILILRNPVDRFISFYEHGIYTLDISPTLSLMDFIQQSLSAAELPLEDSKVSRGIREGYYIDYLPIWEEEFGENNITLFFESFIKDPSSCLKEIMRCLKINEQDLFGLDEVENKTRNYKFRFIHQISLFLNKKFANVFRKFPRLKITLRKTYAILNGKAKIKSDYTEEKQFLSEIYRSKNKLLKAYLLSKNIGQAELPSWLKE